MVASFFHYRGLIMGMVLNEFIKLLNDIAPFEMKEEWDNPGLQVGDPSTEIRKVLISLDPTMEAVRRAVALNAELLITHHPLIFKSINSVNKESYPGNIIFTAIKEGLSIVSMHTNLDMSVNGINRLLAREFRLKDIKPLEINERISQEGGGIGVIGNLESPVNIREFLNITKKILGTKALRVLGNNEKTVSKVAIVGGSGGQFISVSKEKGADLLLTGDLSHHNWLEAMRLGIAMIDGGHFFTEALSMRLFSFELKSVMGNKEIEIIYFDDERAPYEIA